MEPPQLWRPLFSMEICHGQVWGFAWIQLLSKPLLQKSTKLDHWRFWGTTFERVQNAYFYSTDNSVSVFAVQ